MYRQPRASADGTGRSKGQTSNQVGEGEERAKRAYGVGKRWRPRRADANNAKFFNRAISSTGYRGDTTEQIQFSHSCQSFAK
jgi:hypothetical protein